MSIRELIGSAVDDIAEHLGEPVTINGRCVRGIPSAGTITSSSLSVQVASDDSQVSIRTCDAHRVALAIGADVEFRDRKRVVRDYADDNWGWTQIELE